MALTKEQYQAFEAIVGPENISDDPVDLDAWAWRSGQAAMAQDFKPRFEAILMPGSTEEVQAIVRLCNRLGVQFKASSTGWGVYCDAGGPGCIKLDLRRMNRIRRHEAIQMVYDLVSILGKNGGMIDGIDRYGLQSPFPNQRS